MVIILKINNKVKKIISIIVIVFFVFAFILPLLADIWLMLPPYSKESRKRKVK